MTTNEPELCWVAIVRDDGYSLGVVKAGMKGYYETDYQTVDTYKKACEWARNLNARMGITEEEEILMVLKSMRR